MTAKLARIDTGRYRWVASETLASASATSAARCHTLQVQSDNPAVLAGITQFTGLVSLTVVVSGALDLAPLASPLGELERVDVQVAGPIQSADALAHQSLRGLAVRASADRLPALVAELDWAAVGHIPGLTLGCTDPGGCVIDVRALRDVVGLERLGGERVVFGPRDVDAAAFGAAVPATVHTLVSAYADDGDYDRIEGAGVLRGLPSDGPVLDGFDPIERVSLEGDLRVALDWHEIDDEWSLEADIPRLVGADGADDGELNYAAERRLRAALDGNASNERVTYDTSAEALVVHTSEADLRDQIDAALREVLTAIQNDTRGST